MPALHTTIKHKSQRKIAISEDYCWIGMEDPEIDPRAAAMILSHLEYLCNVAHANGTPDEGATVEEIYRALVYFEGYRKLNQQIRLLAKKGLLKPHTASRAPSRTGRNGGFAWRWSLNVPNVQAAIDSNLAEDMTTLRARYGDIMQARLQPNSRRRVAVSRGGDGSAAHHESESRASAPSSVTPLAEPLSTMAMVEHLCPLASKHECPLLNGHLQSEQSRTVEGRSTRAALHKYRPNHSDFPNGRCAASAAPDVPVVQWLQETCGQSRVNSERMARRYDELTLRRYWEWTPYYAQSVDDPAAMFHRAVTEGWREPGRYRRAMLEAADREKTTAEKQLDAARHSQVKRDRAEYEERGRQFIRELSEARRSQLEEEVVERLRANAFVYSLYSRGKLDHPIVRAELEGLRCEIANEWMLGGSPDVPSP